MEQRKAAQELVLGDYIVDTNGERYMVDDLIPLSDGRIFIDAGRLKLAPMGIAMVPVLSDEECAKIDAQILIDDGFEPTKYYKAVRKVDGEEVVMAETSRPRDFVQLGLVDQPGIKFYRLYERREHEWSRDIIRFAEGATES